MTKTITFTISGEKKYQLLLQFLKKLKITWQERTINKLSKKDLEYHQKIIDKGGDMSYIGDVMKWQREVRSDRKLPFDTF